MRPEAWRWHREWGNPDLEASTWRLEVSVDVRCLMVGLNWEAGPTLYALYLHVGPVVIGAFRWSKDALRANAGPS